MSEDWFDRSVYADVDDEARSHWQAERPPPEDRAEDVLDPEELAEYRRRHGRRR